MLSYPSSYAFLNIFIQEFSPKITHALSNLLAPFAIIGNIIFGFYVVAKRGTWPIDSGGILGVMAAILVSSIIIKHGIQIALQRYEYWPNYWIVASALISIGLGALCQESIIDLPCYPDSFF